MALFGVCGFAPVRFLLPAELRPHELLWILPVGACAAALELALLGYLHVPLPISLASIGAVNLAAGVVAVRRRGLPARPPSLGEIAWPLWIALLVACVALVPMFRTGVTTMQGYGSDAHLAAGTGHFLKDHAPGEVAPEEPVDMVPLVWRSKPPIYYPMAAVSELSGFETWEVFAPLAAVMLALAALGFFLLARTALGAGLAGALVAMALIGIDRVALQTAVHPYYNQLWGFFTLPFAILLAYWAAQSRTRGSAVLLGMALLVGAFAYPLAVPIPLIALLVLLWPERRRLRSLYGGKRSLLWMVPLGLVLVVPILGVLEKAASAIVPVVDPGGSLRAWGGDLKDFIPEHQFFALPSTDALVLLAIPLLWALARELRRQPRSLAIALGGVLLFGIVVAAWFRPREFGWYFHFKTLAFVGPIAVALAAVGLSRLRARWAVLLLGFWVLGAVQGAKDEMIVTWDQTPKAVNQLREVDELLPPGASVRLDIDRNHQLWAAYFLAGQPVCSQRPLDDTSYPHVRGSRKADFVLADINLARPRDALSDPIWVGEWYVLYALPPDMSGNDYCSQEMVQTVTSVPIL